MQCSASVTVEGSCGTIEHLWNVHIYEQQFKETEIVVTVLAKDVELSETGI